MTITNEKGLPQAIVDAITLDKHNEPGTVSATTLIKGIKEILLTDRHWDEITVDAKDRIWALWGTTTHKLLEKEYEGTFTEEKFEEMVGSLMVTGRVDCYDMEHEILFDYKTTSAWKIVFKNFTDWYMQGMIYAWLLFKKGLKVSKCKFIAMLRDWSETDSIKMADYPDSPFYEYSFDVTEKDIEDVEQLIRLKVSQLEKNAETPDDEIEPCSKDERWASSDVYAVMKEGRKSSVKNFDNQDDAEKRAKELGSKHYVQFRPGKDKKCVTYCDCRAFCSYYKEHYGTTETEVE